MSNEKNEGRTSMEQDGGYTVEQFRNEGDDEQYLIPKKCVPELVLWSDIVKGLPNKLEQERKLPTARNEVITLVTNGGGPFNWQAGIWIHDKTKKEGTTDGHAGYNLKRVIIETVTTEKGPLKVEVGEEKLTLKREPMRKGGNTDVESDTDGWYFHAADHLLKKIGQTHHQERMVSGSAQLSKRKQKATGKQATKERKVGFTAKAGREAWKEFITTDGLVINDQDEEVVAERVPTDVEEMGPLTMFEKQWWMQTGMEYVMMNVTPSKKHKGAAWERTNRCLKFTP